MPDELTPHRGETVAISADGAGRELKARLAEVLDEMGHTVVDLGPVDDADVPYPQASAAVAQAVTSGLASRGIIVGGSGQGEQISANRFVGIRAALCNDLFTARLSRQHNDANVLTLGAFVVSPDLATAIVDTWLATRFEGGRHARRLALIDGSADEPTPAPTAPGPFRLRPARPDDAAELVEIVAATDPTLREVATAELVPVVRGERPGRFVVAVDERDVPVGTIGWIPDIWGVADVAWLVWLYVRSDRRGTGVADAVVEHVLDDLRSEGCRKVFLDVGNADAHAPAMRFHERHGFRQEGHLLDFWADGEDMYLFGRRLD